MIQNKPFYIKLLFFWALCTIQPAVSAQSANWKIKGDSSEFDFANQVYRYRGNAVFTSENLAIFGDEIMARQNKKGQTQQVHFTGLPARLTQLQKSTGKTLELSANTVNYQLKSKVITAKKQVKLIQKASNNSYFEVKGEQMRITPAPNSILKAHGNPLEITISQPDQPPLQAQASDLSYNQQKQQFEISGNVRLSTGREDIKADKILYNTGTLILKIPESQNQQIEMTQTQTQTQNENQ